MAIAWLWAAAWTVGPVVASWPHVFLGLMLIAPGGAALGVVYSLRDYPLALGAVLIVVGSVLGAVAWGNNLIMAGLALPPLLAGGILIADSLLFRFNRATGEKLS